MTKLELKYGCNPNQKPEQGPGPHAQQQAADWRAAQKRGKCGVCRHDIGGRRLIHTGGAKNEPNDDGLRRAKQAASHQDGDVRRGNRERRQMDIP